MCVSWGQATRARTGFAYTMYVLTRLQRGWCGSVQSPRLQLRRENGASRARGDKGRVACS